MMPSPDAAPPEAAPAHLWLLAVMAAISGVFVGEVGAAFLMVLQQADQSRDHLIDWARQWPTWGWLIPVTAAAVLVTIARWLVQRLAPEASGSGVPRVEAVMRGEVEPEQWVVLPVKFVGGSLAIGAGLALGREGPLVQMGATIGALIARVCGTAPADVRTLSAASAGAGLGVAFNAPLGGLLFVFEELTHRFETRLMVASLAACGAGLMTLRTLLGDQPVFALAPLAPPTPESLAIYLLLGAALGALGALYNRFVIRWLDWFDRFDRVPVTLRAAAVGGLVGAVAWFDPHLVGGGEPIIQGVLNGHFTLVSLATIFAVRWLLGPFSYAAGTPGGLFAPLLLVGAAFGALLGDALHPLLPELIPPTSALALVGMAAFFAAVVRAPLTGVILIVEMSANTTLIIPMLAACLTANIIPALLGSPPIYDTLRERMLGPDHRSAQRPA
ncbi:H(+)/Cl(-) exchange transporter ClcA [uncultured Thiodictyon sp.]|uniref:H(+)/Cl(-) exchange transporter ClcA n=1 Tax=uncultured Thiodictyon sp. TaxID=1846217 RepID=UPI0025F34464|nr:H(+)/Cl(-) exchange transporter ClcA [uncultured Thiodictyon sp.]